VSKREEAKKYYSSDQKVQRRESEEYQEVKLRRED
jgi:hypothetical protein